MWIPSPNDQCTVDVIVMSHVNNMYLCINLVMIPNDPVTTYVLYK